MGEVRDDYNQTEGPYHTNRRGSSHLRVKGEIL